MLFKQNNENNMYPREPQFYYIKVGFKEVKTIQACFRDAFRIRVLKPYCSQMIKHTKLKIFLNYNTRFYVLKYTDLFIYFFFL